MKKQTPWIIIIAVAVLVIAYFALGSGNRGKPQTSEEVAKCIGENSVLYVQLGCSHCEDQEEMFGDNVQYLNTIDCFYERDKCGEIEATPTWEIKGTMYKGVQEIETLRELTGC